LKITPIKTAIYREPIDLNTFIFEYVRPYLKERAVIAITSKIVSLAEGRLVPRSEISKVDLVKREADKFLGITKQGVCLTLTQGLLIPSAGIDESNSEDDSFILYPKDPYASAQKIYEGLLQRSGLKELGIILTDSRSSPLRRGVTGFSLAHWGFNPLKDLIGKEDLFGRSMKATLVNLPDSIAAAAVLVMGETSEAQPLAVIEFDGLEFMNGSGKDNLSVSPEDDLYGSLLINEEDV
jgi:coenzyme F420-0:L-glutamate ligase